MPVSEVLLQQHTEQPSVASPGAAADQSVHSLNSNTGSGDTVRNADIMKAWEAVSPEESDSARLEEQAAVEIDSAKEKLNRGKVNKSKADAAEVESADGSGEQLEASDKETEEEAEAAAEETSDDDSEDRQLTPKESRALIKQRIEMNKRLERKEARLNKQWSEREAQVKAAEARVAQVDRLQAAVDAGDFDGIAKALGVESWNDLNTVALQNMQSPLYKQQRALEAKLKAKEEADKQRETQLAQQRQAAEQAQAIAEWKKDLAAEVSNDSEPAVAALLKARPGLVDNLFAIQQHSFHTNEDAPSAREAVEQLLPAIWAEHQTWTKFFEEHKDSKFLRSLLGIRSAPKTVQVSDQATSKLERQTAKKTSGGPERRDAKPAPKPVSAKSISQAQLASASAQRPMNEKELKAHYEKLLADEWRAAGVRA